MQSDFVPASPGALRVWVLAARVPTLPAAIVPVLVGSASAWAGGQFRLGPFVAALAASLLIQVGTNLANDYFDFRKGADTAERLGPVRVTQAGLVAPETVRNATILTFGAAALLGVYLIAVGGVPILVIGLLSIAAGVLYTGGPWPLAYHGLGDITVFIFFGLVAVIGTAYLHGGGVTTATTLQALPVAALVTAILVVNNLRDIDTDRVAGKHTLAVRLGRGGTRLEYLLLVALAYLAPLLSGAAAPDRAARRRPGAAGVPRDRPAVEPCAGRDRTPASLLRHLVGSWAGAVIPMPDDIRIVRLEACRYRIPYARAFGTAHGTSRERAGLLVRVVAEDGLVGVGEVAAVPEFGTGTLDDAAATVQRSADRFVGWLPAVAMCHANGIDVERPGGGPAAAGLETAVLDLLLRRQQESIAACLSRTPGARVPVNATIGAPDTKFAAEDARRAVADGFGCVKLKVGVLPDDGAELERIAAVRGAIGPECRLRLDANGAWDPDRAVVLIRQAARYDLEYVEQPVPANDLAGLRRVRGAVDVLIAADESACTLIQAHRVSQAEAADLVIVKPMLAGGPIRAMRVAEYVRERGIDAVITSVVEAGIGVTMALHVAAALGPGLRPCGLATASLLTSDLLAEPLAVRGGQIEVPPGPGIGVALDDRALARFASPWQAIAA